METERLIRKWLPQSHMMQLATSSESQPWCCTVYFVADDELNLYWISTPRRRHSREIAGNPKVAAAIPIKFSEAENVVGIQVEGRAERVTDHSILKKGVELYHQRFQHDKTFIEDFLADKRQHKLYRLKPSLFVLFDEQTFESDARKEWKPSR